MSSKRTGLMPSKKKFTAVGGVGARPIAVQNKISTQGPRVETAAPPAKAPAAKAPTREVNLFDIYTFANRFDVNKYDGYKDAKLDNNHWLALIAATVRWKNLIAFHPSMLNLIKTKYKEEFDKDWYGFELLGVNYSYKDGIAGASTRKLKGTNIPYGFLLSINKPMLINGFHLGNYSFQFSQKNIETVFAHELGHALGLCNTLAPEYIITPPSSAGETKPTPVGTKDSYYTPKYKCIIESMLPQTYFEHYKMLNSATTKAISRSPYIILSDDGKHWKHDMVFHDIYDWDSLANKHKDTPRKYYYGNFFNELMGASYNSDNERDFGYFISTKSLIYLTEMRVDGQQMYVEKIPGASEVKSITKIVNPGSTLSKPDYSYVLNGTAGVVVLPKSVFGDEPPIITVEKSFENDAYTVVCPEGHDMNYEEHEEILRTVAKYERIANDPNFAEYKCSH